MRQMIFIKTIKARVQTGFTVAELTIASSIFSIVILTAVAGFIQMGRIFYKGVTVTSTQETANQIYQDISGYFQTASAVSPIKTTPSPGYNYICIGGARYTFAINKKVDASAAPDHSATTGNFGLLKDVLPGGSACEAPCDDNPPAGSPVCNGLPFQNPQELLGDRMRLLKFIIQPASGVPDFYNVSMTLAYGDDEALAYTSSTDPSSGYCAAGAGSQFCSIVDVDTSLSRGFK